MLNTLGLYKMINKKIEKGAFQLARQFFEGELWLEKPSSWKVIWVYILGNVSHIDNGKYKRGEGFFNFTRDLREIGCDITYNQVAKFLKYAKSSKMISTTKSTRGMRIKINKYNHYQAMENYRGETKSETKSKTEAKQKQNRSQTIDNNRTIKQLNNVTKEPPYNPPIPRHDYFSSKEIALKTEAKRVLVMTNDLLSRSDSEIGGAFTVIMERLREGRTYEELEIVARKKLKDPHFIENKKLLNLTTLFSTTHFENYLQEDETQYKTNKTNKDRVGDVTNQ